MDAEGLTTEMYSAEWLDSGKNGSDYGIFRNLTFSSMNFFHS